MVTLFADDEPLATIGGFCGDESALRIDIDGKAMSFQPSDAAAVSAAIGPAK